MNIRATVASLKNALPPGKSYFESTKAAIDAMIRCPAVPAAVISTVLKIYLEKVTVDLPIFTIRSAKLSVVG